MLSEIPIAFLIIQSILKCSYCLINTDEEKLNLKQKVLCKGYSPKELVLQDYLIKDLSYLAFKCFLKGLIVLYSYIKHTKIYFPSQNTVFMLLILKEKKAKCLSKVSDQFY